MKELLGEISARQDNIEHDRPMTGLRLAFVPGVKEGDIFINLLYTAFQQGLVSGVSFVYDSYGEPDEAVWDGARLTITGKRYLHLRR